MALVTNLCCVPFQVEELLFQLVSDPSRIVVEETVKTLLPAILLWIEGGNRPLLPLIQSLISHLFAHVEVVILTLFLKRIIVGWTSDAQI